MNMRCPVCKKKIEWEGNPFRPFCSFRCKMIDLDKWLKEEYRVQEQKRDTVEVKDEEKKD